MTVSDGVSSVSGTFLANGSIFINLSSLADGPLTTSITATDTSGNVATVTGPNLVLDTSFGLNVVTQTAQDYNGTGAADLIEASDTLFAVDNDIRAGNGNDVVIGNAGRDELRGENGADALYGGDGIDRLFGQNGTCLLYTSPSPRD